MFASLFIKKIIFFLTTGTILFYLISFSSVGQVPQDSKARKALLDCQENVRTMNYGNLRNLRREHDVNYKNVLLLTRPEQRAVNQFLKESQSSLIRHGNSNPVKMTTNLFESRNRKTMGYKIAIYSAESREKVATYFAGTEGNILFTHWSGFLSTKKWNCEPTQYSQ